MNTLRASSSTLRYAYASMRSSTRRAYASKASAGVAPAKVKAERPPSSCPEGTVMPGLNYLKDQPAVVALADAEYPEWLWKVLDPKEFSAEEQGPGGAAERYQLRRENKEKIKAQNFMKTQ